MPETDEQGRPTITAARRQAALVVLAAIYGINYVDRQVVGLLAESIKRDLHVSDTQLGALSGIAFALFYATLGIPLAKVAGSIGRRRVVTLSTIVFSVATASGALVSSFWHLAMSRIFVGIGEAGTSPSSLSIISEMYPEEKRTSAIAIFQIGAQVGVLAGFLLAGVVAVQFGWRMGFLVAGLPGMALAILAWKALPRHLDMPQNPPPVINTARQLLRDQHFLLLALSGAAILFTITALGSWIPAYLQRSSDIGLAQIALIFGGSVGILGGMMTWAAGKAADRLYSPGNSKPLLLVSGLLVAMTLLFITFLWTSSALVSISALIIGLSLTVASQPTLLSHVQALVGASERAVATSIYMLITSLFGMATGPFVVGLISDQVGAGSAEGLRVALSWSLIPGLLAIGALVLLAVLKRREDYRSAADLEGR